MAWRHKVLSFLDLVVPSSAIGAVAGLLAYSGYTWFRSMTFDFTEFPRFTSGVLGAYLIFFAAAITLTALFQSAFFSKWIHASYSFMGRALAFIFLGALCIRDENDVPSIVIGCFVIAVGFVYAALQFVSRRGHPQPIFSKDPHHHQSMPRYPSSESASMNAPPQV